MIEAKSLVDRCLGIDVRAGIMNAAVLDPGGAVVSRRSSDFLRAEVVPAVIQMVRSMAQDFPGIQHVGIAMPGLVDQPSGRLAHSTTFPEIADVDFVGQIEDATNHKITLENDANAAAMGEFMLGAGSGSRNMFYATLGEGVGGAFIIDGRIWRGAAGYAGEFGYLTLNSEGMRLEDAASSENIVRRTRSRFRQDSTSSLNLLDDSNITLSSIIQAAQNKDDFSQMMLERTGTYVGTCVAAVINLLNVERIVLGGEIMRARQLVLNAVKRRASELSFKPAYDSTTILEGTLGSDAASIGAAVSAAIQSSRS